MTEILIGITLVVFAAGGVFAGLGLLGLGLIGLGLIGLCLAGLGLFGCGLAVLRFAGLGLLGLELVARGQRRVAGWLHNLNTDSSPPLCHG